jgi:hypothetical protein
MALIRPALLAALIYLIYAISFPDYTGSTYHVVVLSVIAGGAVGLWFLKKILDLGEGGAKFVLELAFLGGVAAFVGYTMPQKSGKPPLTQWAEGARPTRETARRGLEKLGANPDGAIPSKIVALFPKR